MQAVLNTALTRLCSEHPYHTLYSLIALKNGGHGKQTGAGVLVEHATDMSKVAAAAALLDSLRAAQPGRLKAIVDDMNGQVMFRKQGKLRNAARSILWVAADGCSCDDAWSHMHELWYV